MNVKKPSQLDRVLAHLKEIGSITQAEAIQEYGCYRLSAVIWVLRHTGILIETKYETNKNRYGDSVTYARYIYIKDLNEKETEDAEHSGIYDADRLGRSNAQGTVI